MPTELSDSPLIPRNALSVNGVVRVEATTLAEHVLIDRHWEAVAWYFATSDARPVSSFRLLSVLDPPLACSEQELRAWPSRLASNRARPGVR